MFQNTLQIFDNFLRKRHFLFDRSGSKSLNQFRSSAFHCRNFYCFFNIISGNIRQFTIIGFDFSFLPQFFFLQSIQQTGCFLDWCSIDFFQYFFLLTFFNKPINESSNTYNQSNNQQVFPPIPNWVIGWCNILDVKHFLFQSIHLHIRDFNQKRIRKKRFTVDKNLDTWNNISA